MPTCIVVKVAVEYFKVKSVVELAIIIIVILVPIIAIIFPIALKMTIVV